MPKLTRKQAQSRLFEAHSKFLKIYSGQGMNKWMDADDLKDLLKIVNRINGRMERHRR